MFLFLLTDLTFIFEIHFYFLPCISQIIRLLLDCFVFSIFLKTLLFFEVSEKVWINNLYSNIKCKNSSNML